MISNRFSSLLLTGGTGSFGQAFLAHVLAHAPELQRIVIFSRDELKQYEQQRAFPKYLYPQLEWVLGDIRDRDSILRACRGIDVVVHAAALKQVPTGEMHPEAFVKTNIDGTRNLIEASLAQNVRQVLALSTSKAVAPLNLYGATKLCADKLLLAANNIHANECRFSVLRCGNIFGSRGSVVPLFWELKSSGRVPVTHPEMTRFHITLDRLNECAVQVLRTARGGEIYIPQSSSYRIVDLAKAVAPDAEIDWIGIRPGEKLHEEMIPQADAHWIRKLNAFYVQYSPLLFDRLPPPSVAEPVAEDFSYTSDKNPDFLTVDDLRKLVLASPFAS